MQITATSADHLLAPVLYIQIMEAGSIISMQTYCKMRT